ncbi:MAG: hypothetical protein PHR50_04850 [Lachnospiraceae bacterium]|nr:hypothetical protein [Lachnospiraceae bacterium]
MREMWEAWKVVGSEGTCCGSSTGIVVIWGLEAGFVGGGVEKLVWFCVLLDIVGDFWEEILARI